MLIDAHTHAFLPEDLEVLNQRLTMMDAHLDDDDPLKWRIHGSGLVEGLLALQDQAEVERMVFLPVSSKRSRVSEMNRWSADTAAAHPRVIPFGLLHPHGEMESDLAELVDLGLRGVKLHPFLQHFTLDDPPVGPMLAMIADQGLPVILDTIHVPGLIQAKPHLDWAMAMFNFPSVDGEAIARLAAAHPGLKVIAAHGGCLFGWSGIGPLHDLPNVYIDISYLAGLIEPRRLADIIRRHGPDRVIYGTDAPWRHPAAFRAWFEDLPLSPGEREAVAAGTLAGLLDL